jgi:DNA polymerase (family 10)
MDKQQVARILDEIGTIMEVRGENSFRCLAFHNAARAIEQLQGDLAEMIAEGTLRQTRGIGTTIYDMVTTLVATGRHPVYDELRAKVPAGVFQMLRLPGVGPKKVRVLFEELHIQDLDRLRLACLQGEVAALKGFGEKTQQKILEGIDFLDRAGQRVRIDEATEVATFLVAGLRKAPGIRRLEVCGSLRRRKETINDLDILVSADNSGPIMDCFVGLPGVSQVVGKGETKSSVVIELDLGRGRRVAMNADLRVVRDEQFPFALHYFTGCKEHNVGVRARAQEYGLKLNEYELVGTDRIAACKEEADIFRALDLDYIPPELREMTGEIEAAAEHRLPALIESGDLQGTFHCHTTWSDGSASIKEMADAARKLGFHYLGIADHSQSLTVAYGLTPDRVRQQHAEIDALNAACPDFRIFKGTECDILVDGSLDFDDETLASFDFVVASVHSQFNLTPAEMTARVVRALSHPRVTMLGHATGRLLLRRDGYKLDLEAILQTAAKHGKMIEINSHPQRLELDWVHCRRAKTLGVQLVINPDAHSMADIGYAKTYGIDVARRGWIEKKDVFNTRPVADVVAALANRAG